MDIVRDAGVTRDHAVQLSRVIDWLFRLLAIEWKLLGTRQILEDRTGDLQSVFVVLGQVVRDARDARVHVPAAQFFGAYLFSGRGLDQRRATKKDSSLAFDDDVLIGHCWHIRPAGRTRAREDGPWWVPKGGMRSPFLKKPPKL